MLTWLERTCAISAKSYDTVFFFSFYQRNHFLRQISEFLHNSVVFDLLIMKNSCFCFIKYSSNIHY